MNNSKIEWCDFSWNPFVGCNKVSAGCENCYAERMAWRLANNTKLPKETRAKYKRVVKDGHWTGRIEFFPERLKEPFRLKKPRRIFVGSMGDMFHESMPYEFVDKIMAVAASTPSHVYVFLTKRPERMRAYFERVIKGGPIAANLYQSKLIDFYQRNDVDLSLPFQVPEKPTPELRFIYDSAIGIKPYHKTETKPKSFLTNHQLHWREWPLSNVWLGVTAENQEQAETRIPVLLEISAAKRFVSIEPMLGPIELHGVWNSPEWWCEHCGREVHAARVTYEELHDYCGNHVGNSPVDEIDLVIVGGETGPGARPMHPDWVRKVRDDCQAANVAFFFKSWGEWAPSWGGGDHLVYVDGHVIQHDHEHPDAGKIAEPVWRIGKKRAGYLLDGKEWREWPK